MAGSNYDTPALRETLKRLIRSQMVLKGMEYKELSERLEVIGIHQRPGTLRTKITTGTLGAQLLLAILIAIGMRTLDLEQVQDVIEDIENELAQDHSNNPATPTM